MSNSQRWKRPDSVPYPSVWARFEGRKEINGVKPKFWIQDLTEELHETAIEYLVKGFLRDEPICSHSDLSSDKEAVEELRSLWREGFKDRLGLICFMENPDPNGKPITAGLNATYLISKCDPHYSLKSKKGSQLCGVLDYVTKVKNPFEEFGVDEYMYAMGLYVFPEFRGQGLGIEILKARAPLGRAVGLKVTTTVFTATASQIQATRAGFKDFAIASYAEIKQKNPDYYIPGIEEHTKTQKYMYMLF